jgi:hypothetical protein
MSQENIKQFYQTFATDEALKAQLAELLKPYQEQEMEESKKAELVESILLPIATQKGLPFTIGELRQYEIENAKGESNGELSVEELATVAGGNIGGAVCFIIGVGAGILDISLCFFVGIDL